jgi:hypothetical protein
MKNFFKTIYKEENRELTGLVIGLSILIGAVAYNVIANGVNAGAVNFAY